MNARPNTVERIPTGTDRRRRGVFDWFVLAGAVVNVIVVSILFGYWLMH